MTEFEEIALKKIIKEYLIDSVYYRINILIGKYGISNSEISKYIGWDPAGYNQKYNRSNDLRITTFIKIYAAICEIIADKEKDFDSYDLGRSIIGLNDLISEDEVQLGYLFNHISAVAEGKTDFMNLGSLDRVFIGMKSFVLRGKHNKKFNERIINVYIKYLKLIGEKS